MNNCSNCKVNKAPYRFSKCIPCMGIKKKCISCDRTSFLGSGFCQHHYYEEFDKSNIFTRQYKEKIIRWDMVSYFARNYNIKVCYDKKLTGCSLSYRPDIFFEFLNCLFLIEVDENQHKLQIELDEIRDKEIYDENIGVYDNIFTIRINPDKFSNRPAMTVRKQIITGPGEVKAYMEDNEEEIKFRLKVLRYHLHKLFKQILAGERPLNRLILCYD